MLSLISTLQWRWQKGIFSIKNTSEILSANSVYFFISCGQNLENDLSVGQHCIFQLNFQHLCTCYVTKLFTWISVHKMGSPRTNCKCSLFRTGAWAALFSRKTSPGLQFGRLFWPSVPEQIERDCGQRLQGLGYVCHKQAWIRQLSQTHYNKNPSSESSGDTV